VFVVAAWLLFAGEAKGPEGSATAEAALRKPAEIGQLISVKPLPEMDGPMCEWVPASANSRLVAALRQQPRAATPAADPASRDEVARREPLRVIRDSYPSFSGVAVDTQRDEVYAADENLLQILVYHRLDNTPETATMTEPRRVLGGPQSKIEFVCGLYFDQKEGQIYASHGDTTQTLVFSHDQQGDVPPVRELDTPKSRVIAIDEENQELFMTSQHDSAVVVWRKQATGKEAPVRLLQGDRTRLANPHGIAIDNQNDLIFVTNHGQKSDRDPSLGEERDGEKRVRNWPLERSQAIPGSGRFLPPSITVHSRTAQGNTPPLRMIEGPKTRLNWPAGIILDKQRGELFVANDVDHSILVFRATAQGNVAPLRVLKGPKTALKYPSALFLDTENEELWVANYGNHSLTVFRPTAEGDTAPLRTIRSGPARSQALMIGNPGAVEYDTKRQEILVPN
jgi:DNA-binding beta-propeller fold protein YncE